MLVDLGRNDLGRVSRAGTVTVSKYMEVERYSHVLHLVSHVEARLRHDADALAWFRRAMELDPGYTPAVLKAAQASLNLGRSRDALGLAQAVLAREPQNADALHVSGQAAAALRSRP